MTTEVEKGFTPEQTTAEVERCLNCDVADALHRFALHRVRRLHRHLPGGLPDDHAERATSRTCATRFLAPALNLEQPLFVSAPLKQTGRVMVKDENVCLHCGLCAERCPTYAWDMRKFVVADSATRATTVIPLMAVVKADADAVSCQIARS